MRKKHHANFSNLFFFLGKIHFKKAVIYIRKKIGINFWEYLGNGNIYWKNIIYIGTKKMENQLGKTSMAVDITKV